jgi:CubicO group peptidase (beta-lactamase class C family)
MALVDDGPLALEEPATRLLPELASRQVLRRMDGPIEDTVAAKREVTVRDLLTFTFGFGMHAGMFTAATPWPIVLAATEAQLATIGPPDPKTPPEADEWIERLGSLPLMAQPGELWLYNTPGRRCSACCVNAQRARRPTVRYCAAGSCSRSA